ncbi:hypothetical protein HanPI659440_Chr17g0679671 [Helianthus annuus]|nr:hypothetical protein HanPI659440_Chr17g0679671 [Helianthus annuus]
MLQLGNNDHCRKLYMKNILSGHLKTSMMYYVLMLMGFCRPGFGSIHRIEARSSKSGTGVREHPCRNGSRRDALESLAYTLITRIKKVSMARLADNKTFKMASETKYSSY